MSHATGTLYIVSAPSGAGKTSLVKALLEQTRGTIATSYQSIKKTVGDDLQDIAKLSDTAAMRRGRSAA